MIFTITNIQVLLSAGIVVKLESKEKRGEKIKKKLMIDKLKKEIDKLRKDLLKMFIFGFILGVYSAMIYYIFAK